MVEFHWTIKSIIWCTGKEFKMLCFNNTISCIQKGRVTKFITSLYPLRAEVELYLASVNEMSGMF